MKNYKVHVFVGITSFNWCLQYRSLTTLKWTFLLPAAWPQKMKLATDICYRSASNDHISVYATIWSFVRYENLRVRIWFAIADVLASQMLMRTSFTDRFEKSIFYKALMIVNVQYGPLTKESAHAHAVDPIIIWRYRLKYGTVVEPVSYRFSNDNTNLIRPKTQILVQVRGLQPVFIISRRIRTY